MSQAFDMRIEEANGIYIISLRGAIDTETLDQFTTAMMPIMARSCPQIIFMCRDLNYLNSRALGYLTQYHRTAMVRQGRVLFCQMSDRLLKAFDRLRLKDSLFFCNSKEEGLSKFAD